MQGVDAAAVTGRIRTLLRRHAELVRFCLVGGLSFAITTVVNYTLKLTVLGAKPVTALVLAVLVATVASYVLSREWSFRTRGGRQRRHEAALFFLVSGIAIGLNALPMVISRYLLHLAVPYVDLLTQEVADFVSGFILGTLLGTLFRWWGFKRWVFPQAGARSRTVTAPVPGNPAGDTDIRGSRAA